MTLEEIYNKFANFGKGITGSSGMDGKAFAKFCKDCHIVTPKFTSTDVDLIFANVKVKPKTERKISYNQFLIALELVAEKKGVSLEALGEKIMSTDGPQANNVQKADASGIYDKLTDSSLYTGAHKSRFEGKEEKVVKPPTAKTTTTATTSPTKKSTTTSSATKTATKTSTSSTATKKSSDAPKSTTASSPTKSKSSGGSIFDRLTDSSKYTGAHKHRFDADGKGRGKEGRDVGGNGTGTHGGRSGDLSSMTRQNLN